MANEVTLSVRSDLNKITEELGAIGAKSREVSSEIKDTGKTISDGLTQQAKKTTTFLQDVRSIAMRTGDALKEDFKTLVGINAALSAFKLNEMFRGSVKESVALSDSIQKFGTSLGIARGDFASFQTYLTKGLGDIGASSEEAASALEGLRGTGIQGKENIMAYAKTGVQLSSLGGERGKSGDITKLMAEVVRAQGKPLNAANMDVVARAVTKAMEVSGKSASEVLGTMKETFGGMATERKKTVTASGVSQMSVAESVAGPGATSGLTKFLKAGMLERLPAQMQGFGKIFTKEGGIDIKGLKEFSKEFKRIPGDARASLKTFGNLTDDEAQGITNLLERTDQLEGALGTLANASDDYADKFQKNMTMTEAFSANLNKVKGLFAGPMTAATQGLTHLLSKTSGSTGGAAAIVGGGALLTAFMAKAGLGTIGKALGMGGLAKGAMGGAIAKQMGAQPVYVVNASEIGGGGGLGGAGGILSGGGGLLSMLKTAPILSGVGALGVGAAGAAGYAAGSAINEIPGVSDAIVSGFEKIAQMFGGGPKSDDAIMREAQAKFAAHQTVTHKIELNKTTFKETSKTTRGKAN